MSEDTYTSNAQADLQELLTNVRYYMGQSLGVMAFVYHLGNRGLMSRGEPARSVLEPVMKESLAGVLGVDSTAVIVTDVANLISRDAGVLSTMLLNSVSRNRMFAREVATAVMNLRTKFDKSLPKTKQDKGYYVSEVRGNDGASKECDYYPIIKPDESDCFDKAMAMAWFLFVHNLLDPAESLPCREVDIRTGNFVEDVEPTDERRVLKRVLGLPSEGRFALGGRNPRSLMYHTFNGTSLQCIVMLGEMMTRMQGITSVSWSTHRGVSAAVPLGYVARRGTARGSRTVAGTMVFPVTDQHPLIDLFSVALPMINPEIKSSDYQQYPRMLPDELPPFDMTLLLMNEYGIASVMTIYGIQFVDDGAVHSSDAILSEEVLQYVAKDIDPIMQIIQDENGVYDFAGLFSSENSDLWKRRQMAAAGVLHSKLEDDYNRYYEGVQTTYSEAMNTSSSLLSTRR